MPTSSDTPLPVISPMSKLNRPIALLQCLMVALAVYAVPPDAVAGPTFEEYFSQSTAGSGWTINNLQSSLAWQSAGQQPGFQYSNTGSGYAYSSWNVAAQPFDLRFDVTISNGVWHQWRRDGVYVALSTASPGSYTANDISAVVAIQLAGPAASVRKGVPFSGSDVELSNISAWPTGGNVESIAWPNTNIGGTQLTVEVQRTSANLMVFSFYRPDYKNGTVPWWTGSWQIPSNLTSTAFNFVNVQAITTPAYTTQGVVSNIRGYVLSAGIPPSVQMVLPLGSTTFAGGHSIDITGSNFQSGAQVKLLNANGGATVSSSFVSSSHLTAVLPSLANGSYSFKIVNPNGQDGDLTGGLDYYGAPTITVVQPREATPLGGDIVTLVGQGFDNATQVRINGQTAAVAQLLDACHLRVTVPAGSVGPATVTATSGSTTFAGSPAFGYSSHPYMQFVGASGLASLRTKFNDPQYAAYRALIVRNSQVVPNSAVDPFNDITPEGLGVDTYLYPYLFQQDQTDKDNLWAQINGEIDRIDFTGPDYFRLMAAGQMAAAYDSLFPELTAQQRTDFLSYLDRAYAAYSYLQASNDWFVGQAGGNYSNVDAISNSAGGQVALAIMNSTSTTATVTKAVANILKFSQNTIAADGGDVESALYWNLGLTWYLQFAHALQNALGTDRALFSQPNLALNYKYPQVLFGADGKFVPFNDSQPTLEGLSAMADLGTRLNQPLMLYLADLEALQMVNYPVDDGSRGDVAAFAFMWRGSAPTPAFPGMPTSVVLSTMNWGAMRSDTSLQPNLYVGVKGSTGYQTQHTENDTGSFVIQSRGESFLIDPGYNQPGAAQHSVSVIDGASPGTTGASLGSVYDQNGVRSMTVDSTPGYGTGVAKVRRTVTTYLDKAVIVVDDYAPATGSPGAVVSSFQTGNITSINSGNNSFTIQGTNSSMRAQLYGPAVSLTNSGPNNFGNSWIYAHNQVKWYTVKAAYTISASQPLVTIFTVQGTGVAAVSVSWVNYAPGLISVALSDGEVMTFNQSAGTWALASASGGGSGVSPNPPPNPPTGLSRN